MKCGCLIGMVAGLLLLFPPKAEAEDTAILAVDLNEESKGEFMAEVRPGGDFLFAEDDLKAMGFRELQGQSFLFDNKSFLSLKSLKGVTFIYDEAKLTIHINADPVLLQRTEVDWSYKKQSDIIIPRDRSFFLNYGITQGFDNGKRLGAFTSTQEVGMRTGDYLLLSDSLITRVEGVTKFTRLISNVTRDNRSSLTRMVLGDVYAGSGVLGSDVLIGGFGFFKKYSIEPSLWKQPTMDYSGFLALPSQVKVYLDGLQVGSEKFSAGGFDLKNIPVSDGLHRLEVRVRDMLGREQTLTQSYYSSDILMRKGFQDYGYSLGIRRKAFGTESNHYDGFAFSAYHRYGITSSSTLGFRAEGGRSLINGGGQLSLRIGSWGILDASAAWSSGRQGMRGMAANILHSFLGNNFNLRVQASAYSARYMTLGSMETSNFEERPHYVFKSGIGYRTKKLGSVSLDLTLLSKISKEKNSVYSATYSRNLTQTLAVSTTYRQVMLKNKDNQLFVTFNYYPHKAVTVSAGYQRESNAGVSSVQVQKNPPSGTGLSYRIHLQKRNDDKNGYTKVNPYVQYNGSYGIYSVDYRSKMGEKSADKDYLEASVTGSIVFASGVWGFSRPIQDSFAIVRAGGLHGVRTYHNNHEVGVTDRAGNIVIPNMNAYVDNLVAINDQDIPVHYALKDVNRYLSPAWRSGTLIRFDAVKTQAFSGKLCIKTDQGEQPLEYMEMTLENGKETLNFMTARDGEFYLENIAGGLHTIRFIKDQKPVVFTLKIPVSDAMMVDLGRVIVEKAP
jgi:outer membrane usher protein